ncbi:Hypothetical predicted protein [Octopus vulgaris]|uniref:Uncharacterized protein n=1 Tax=Octopus vulgaris TaxID=6645 RepID=A0AA36ALS6_OCTVU|nr:Hypothetical predicted protein [Octopus vulgaris]
MKFAVLRITEFMVQLNEQPFKVENGVLINEKIRVRFCGNYGWKIMGKGKTTSSKYTLIDCDYQKGIGTILA